MPNDCDYAPMTDYPPMEERPILQMDVSRPEMPTIRVLVATSSHYCYWCATFPH